MLHIYQTQKPPVVMQLFTSAYLHFYSFFSSANALKLKLFQNYSNLTLKEQNINPDLQNCKHIVSVALKNTTHSSRNGERGRPRGGIGSAQDKGNQIFPREFALHLWTMK